jgi:hypothetical protein
MTTPPISSLSIRTPALCWLLSGLGHEARKAAMPTATTPKYTNPLVLMLGSFLVDAEGHTAPRRIALINAQEIVDAESIEK